MPHLLIDGLNRYNDEPCLFLGDKVASYKDVRETASQMVQALQSKAAFIPLQPGVNTATAAALGMSGTLNPEACRTLFVAAADEDGSLDRLAGRIDPKAYVIVMAVCESPLTARADLVLPMAAWLERSGTYTNTEGTLLRAHAALPPSGQARPDWDIMGRLAEKLGVGTAAAKAGQPSWGF